MKKTWSYLAMALAAIILAALTPATLPAQSIWLDRSHDQSLGFEILIPNFKTDDDEAVSGLAMFLSLRTPLSERIRLTSELPFVHGKIESNSFFFRINESQSTFGNPYLGLEIGQKDSPVFGELGVRVPLASEDNFGATLVGFTADVDRLEAFLPNTLPIMGMLNYHRKEKSGFSLRLRGGPSLLVYTKADAGDDGSDLFIGYSAQAGYESERVSVLGGVTGRANMTEENADFGERSLHQLGFNASVGLGNVRPGIHFRLPLDEDLKDFLDFVLGLNLGIQLK
jgi:hypothetical protein